METAEAVRVRHVVGRMALLALGAGVMIVGLLMPAGELAPGDERDPTFVLAGAILAAGGAALVFLHRLRLRPSPPGVIATVAVALAGTGAGLVHVSESLCCMFAYLVGRGYPFEWLRRGHTAETAAAAKSQALQQAWTPNWHSLLADAVFWGAAGVLLVVAVALVRRTMRRRRSPDRPGAG